MNFTLRHLMFWSIPLLGFGYLVCKKNGNEKTEDNIKPTPRILKNLSNQKGPSHEEQQ